MMHSGRRALAFLVVKIIKQNHAQRLYDMSSGSYHNFRIDLNGVSLDMFDASRNCYITGKLEINKWNLFDQCSSAGIEIEIVHNEFTGHDHCSHYNFRGIVGNDAVSFYDDETKTYYNFVVFAETDL